VAGDLGSGQIFTACSFDGEARRCLFDSGSASSHAESNGMLATYPVIAPATQSGASGIQQTCDWVAVRAFSSAGITVPEHQIVRCEGPNPGNVVGIDFFQGKTLLLSGTELTAIDEPIPAPRLAFTFAPAGLILLPTSLGAAVWDTGAGLTSVDTSYALAHPELFIFVQDVDGGDSTGHAVKMKLFTLKEITVGGHAWKDLSVLGFDFTPARAGGIGLEANLILGYNLITRANWALDLRTRSFTLRP
jgi:hypothetical protein